jgi:hypothetical protein
VKTLIKKNQEQLKKEKLKNRVLNSYKKSIKNLKKEYSNKFVVNVPVKIKVTIQDGEVQWLYENDILSSVDVFLLEHMNIKDKIINKAMKDMDKKYLDLYKSFIKEMESLESNLDKIDDLFFEISK